jgi:replicative DNA helicase
MEMGLSDLTARFINIATTGFNNSLSTHFIERDFKAGKTLENILLHLSDLFNDKLLVSENSNMTSDKYDLLIDRITRERGRVDVLIVDGMSMMGGTGTELERVNEHSKQLKELAKKWNILVLPIVHVTRGEELTTRDLTRRARGSEKIADNGDFFITFSQIKDGLDTYLPNQGFYHCWDKRGTGLRIEKSWHFDIDSLRMIEDTDPFTEQYKPLDI